MILPPPPLQPPPPLNLATISNHTTAIATPTTRLSVTSTTTSSSRQDEVTGNSPPDPATPARQTTAILLATTLAAFVMSSATRSVTCNQKGTSRGGEAETVPGIGNNTTGRRTTCVYIHHVMTGMRTLTVQASTARQTGTVRKGAGRRSETGRPTDLMGPRNVSSTAVAVLTGGRREGTAAGVRASKTWLVLAMMTGTGGASVRTGGMSRMVTEMTGTQMGTGGRQGMTQGQVTLTVAPGVLPRGPALLACRSQAGKSLSLSLLGESSSLL